MEYLIRYLEEFHVPVEADTRQEAMQRFEEGVDFDRDVCLQEAEIIEAYKPMTYREVISHIGDLNVMTSSHPFTIDGEPIVQIETDMGIFETPEILYRSCHNRTNLNKPVKIHHVVFDYQDNWIDVDLHILSMDGKALEVT